MWCLIVCPAKVGLTKNNWVVQHLCLCVPALRARGPETRLTVYRAWPSLDLESRLYKLDSKVQRSESDSSVHSLFVWESQFPQNNLILLWGECVQFL